MSTSFLCCTVYSGRIHINRYFFNWTIGWLIIVVFLSANLSVGCEFSNFANYLLVKVPDFVAEPDKMFSASLFNKEALLIYIPHYLFLKPCIKNI